MDVQNPIFIVGPGRSGTTLLRSLVSAHSRISVTPETQFMQWVDERWNVLGAPDEFESFWATYTEWVRFQDLDIDPDRCRELLEGSEHSFQNVFRVILRAYAERRGVPRVGEKSPSHVHYLETLFEWFPDARVLITMRDPRAVVASQLGTPYVRERLEPLSLRGGIFIAKRRREIIRYADDWAHIFEDIAPKWTDDSRVKVVRYEDLVQDSENEVRAICTFLNETFEPAILNKRTSSKVPSPAGEIPDKEFEEWRQKHHAKSRAPISPDSLDKWKTRLNPGETAIIEKRCKAGMEANGYRSSLPSSKHYRAHFSSYGYLGLCYMETQARMVARKLKGHVRSVLK